MGTALCRAVGVGEAGCTGGKGGWGVTPLEPQSSGRRAAGQCRTPKGSCLVWGCRNEGLEVHHYGGLRAASGSAGWKGACCTMQCAGGGYPGVLWTLCQPAAPAVEAGSLCIADSGPGSGEVWAA